MFLPRRLDKYIRDSTRLSAPAARRAIDEGRVQVLEGDSFQPPAATPTLPSARCEEAARIVFEEDAVLLDGQRIHPRQEHHTYLLNKPKGVTCSTRDPDGRRDLSEYISQLEPGSFPVGRLDRETTGLLLFTTEGDLATAITRPEHTTPKTYWLWLDEQLEPSDERLLKFTSGVELSDGLAKAAHAEILVTTPAYSELELTLHTGRNRQIRRMCHALDLRLVHLHRKSVGRLKVAPAPLGSARELTTNEVERLWEDAGGRALVTRRRISALERDAERARNEGAANFRLERWLSLHGPGVR